MVRWRVGLLSNKSKRYMVFSLLPEDELMFENEVTVYGNGEEEDVLVQQGTYAAAWVDQNGRYTFRPMVYFKKRNIVPQCVKNIFMLWI